MISRPRSSRLRITQAPTGLKRSSTLASSKLTGSPARKVLGGSDRTLGKRKRTVPKVMSAMPPEKVYQAIPIQLKAPRKPRRVVPALAGGLAGAGLGGNGGVAGLGRLGVTTTGAGRLGFG